MSMRCRLPIALLLYVILPLALCPGAATAARWHGSEDMVDGVPNVLNPDKPYLPPRTAQPVELWRIGGENDPDQYMLGFVTDVEVGDDGTCYLLDSSLDVIHVYDADGTYRRDIGRPGEGPGEFRGATDFMLMAGGRIGVIQILPAKIVTMDVDGVPGDYFATCGGTHGLSILDRAEAAGPYIVVGGACGSPGRGVRYGLDFVGPDGMTTATLYEEIEKSPDGNINITTNHPHQFTSHWALAADGRVYVAPAEQEYRIDVYGPDARLQRVIRREYETLKRSDEDLAADRKRQEEMRQRFGGMVQLVSRTYERDIAELLTRPGGRLWVLSSESLRDRTAGALGPFEVYDADGRFERRLSLEVDFDPGKDDFLIKGDRLFVLKQALVRPTTSSTHSGGGMQSMVVMMGGGEEDEDDDPTPPSVVCYRLD